MATMGLVGVVLLLSVATITSAKDCPHELPLKFYDNCYRIVDHQLTWKEAQEVCQAYDANLADVMTKEENDFLIDQLKKAKMSRAWIGATDRGRAGVFKWTYSSMELGIGFTDWHKGEPNNSGGDESCVEIKKQDDVYAWNDLMCRNKEGFICKQRMDYHHHHHH